jgi:Domain of unknown function (DUF4833)
MKFWKFAPNILLLALPLAAAQETTVPLFVIERNANPNVVRYEARLRDGKLYPQQPVVAYWVMATEGGRRQELNILERIKAYGFTLRPGTEPESYVLTIVSDKKKEIRIIRMGTTVRAAARIGACEAYLEKVFVTLIKKFAVIDYPESAEMIGTDVTTGAKCRERVTPADR